MTGVQRSSLIHNLRRALHGVSGWLARFDQNVFGGATGPPLIVEPKSESFLRGLDYPDDGNRRYVEIHMERFRPHAYDGAAPSKTGRVLELIAYMQMTPVLGSLLGYKGSAERISVGWVARIIRQFLVAVARFSLRELIFSTLKRILIPIQMSTSTQYSPAIFEHFLHDPMHMLVECRPRPHRWRHSCTYDA